MGSNTPAPGGRPRATEPEPAPLRFTPNRRAGWIVVGCLAGAIVLLIVLPHPAPDPSRTRILDPPRATSTRTAPATTARAWNQGGTLHRATVDEWRRATGSNRLASDADWAARNRGMRSTAAWPSGGATPLRW